MTNEEVLYHGIRTAAGMLGVSSLEYARKLLGEPDAKEKCKEGVRFLYSPAHIERAKVTISSRKSDKGKRSCYHCRNRFDPSELRSGICPDCQAWKLALNFACNGDCTKCPPSAEKICKLKHAIRKLERRIELFYR